MLLTAAAALEGRISTSLRTVTDVNWAAIMSCMGSACGQAASSSISWTQV
jgi:hypothetical protein